MPCHSGTPCVVCCIRLASPLYILCLEAFLKGDDMTLNNSYETRCLGKACKDEHAGILIPMIRPRSCMPLYAFVVCKRQGSTEHVTGSLLSKGRHNLDCLFSGLQAEPFCLKACAPAASVGSTSSLCPLAHLLLFRSVNKAPYRPLSLTHSFKLFPARSSGRLSASALNPSVFCY